MTKPNVEQEAVREWLREAFTNLRYESSRTGERGLLEHHIEQFSEKLAPALARKIEEARLSEAKWWKRQIESRLHGMAFHKRDVENIADAIEAQRIAELERKLS